MPSNIVLILLLLFVGSGCTAARQSEETNPFGFPVGDTVTVVTKDSAEYQFEITDIDKASIIGKTLKYR